MIESILIYLIVYLTGLLYGMFIERSKMKEETKEMLLNLFIFIAVASSFALLIVSHIKKYS